MTPEEVLREPSDREKIIEMAEKLQKESVKDSYTLGWNQALDCLIVEIEEM